MTTTTVALRWRLAREPHTWVYPVAGAAALTVVVHHLASGGAGAHHGHHHESAMAAADSMPDVAAASPPLWAGWLWWTVMAAAMMLPIAARGAGRVARAGLWHRRHVAMVEYLGGYLAMWSLAGLVTVGLVAAVWPGGAPAMAAGLVLLVAAGWQVMPVRRRVLRRCRGAGFVNVGGWRADRDCAAVGCADGRRGVFTCGPAMAVMALSHSLILMAALTVLLCSERSRGPNPAQRAGRPLEAWGLAGLAVAASAWALRGAGQLP
jgi:predicted metal-binding membrane protein